MLKTQFSKDTVVAFSDDGLLPIEFEGQKTLGELLEEWDMFYPPMKADPNDTLKMIPDDDPQAEWDAMYPIESSRTFRNCDLSDGVGSVTCCGVRYWATKIGDIKERSDEWRAIFSTLTADPFDEDCLKAILFLLPILGVEDEDLDNPEFNFSNAGVEFLDLISVYGLLQERITEMADDYYDDCEEI